MEELPWAAESTDAGRIAEKGIKRDKGRKRELGGERKETDRRLPFGVAEDR